MGQAAVGASDLRCRLRIHRKRREGIRRPLIEWRAYSARTEQYPQSPTGGRLIGLCLQFSVEPALPVGLTQAMVVSGLGIHMRTLPRWQYGEGDPPRGVLFRWPAVVGVQLRAAMGQLREGNSFGRRDSNAPSWGALAANV